MTVWGRFQLPASNVSVAGEAVPSAGRSLLSAMATSAWGCDVSRTENAALPPASLVTRPAVGETVMPAASLSWLTTSTFAASRPP